MSDIIHQTMNDAVVTGIFPSAQLLVAKKGAVLINEAYGNAVLDTIFDVASLTKPISTTTLAIQLVAEDKIRLDDPVTITTLRPLLSHSSGLPAWRPYYQIVPQEDIGTSRRKQQVINAAGEEPLVYKTGNESVYSDIGFILLGEIIEKVSGKTLDKLFTERIAKPLGLENTFFVPLKPSHHLAVAPSRHFAPTEDCPWRKKVMQGWVHDQNCYAMGGVAGHAGLFSTTSDIHKFILAFVESYKSDKGFLPSDVVERFLPFRHPLTECNTTWLLGWDRPSHTNSQAGSHFSKKSIGHLGYTGCSMWIDLEKDFWIVLLTNRIHPTITNEKIRSFLPMIYNMIYEELV